MEIEVNLEDYVGMEVVATHRSGTRSKGVILRSTRILEDKGTYPFLLNGISYTIGGRCWRACEDPADIVNVTFKLAGEGNKHVTVKTEFTYILSLTEKQAEQLLKPMEKDGDFTYLRGTALGLVHTELRELFKDL